MDDTDKTGGWLRLYRCLFRKPIWLQATPQQAAIMITLLSMANFADREWQWEGKQFKAKPGQFVTSAASIIKRCPKGTSRQNVRSALARLEKYGFLTMTSTKTGMLISIINWALYQGNDEEPNQAGNQRPTNTQPLEKKEKNVKETDMAFFAFWKAYPKKTAKAAAAKAWAKLKPDETLCSQIMTGLLAAKQSHSWQKDNGQYVPYPATWLNGRRWEDELQSTSATFTRDSDRLEVYRG